MTRVLQLYKTESHDLDNSQALTGFEHSLYRRLQNRGLTIILRVLNKYFELKEAGPDEPFHRELRFLSTAFIFSHGVPPLSTMNSLSSVVIDTANQRFLQRINLTDNNYRRATGRIEVDMVKADTAKTLTRTIKEKRHLWFAKFFSIISINHRRKSDGQLKMHNLQRCLKCKLHWNWKMVFVQWFKAVDERMLYMDELDNILNCSKKKWQ